MPPANRIRSAAWKPLVVCPTPDLHQRLQAALAELAVESPCPLTAYPPSGVVSALVKKHSSNICFLEAATDSENAQQLISELAPLVPVVALIPGNDADLILRCLRRGASEFIADPTTDAVLSVFERLARNHSDAPHHTSGAVYCIFPGKPGCGASTLAAHLAVQLRANGVNPVLLVDGDHLTASLAFLLKLKPEFHLEDVRRDWGRMDDDLWSRLTLPAFGVDVLAAPSDPTIQVEVSRKFAAELLAFWRERYKVIVLDFPDVRAAADCGFSGLADLSLMVTTNDMAALQASGRSLRYLDAATGDRSKLRLILNRYTPATGLKKEDVKTALSLVPFATIANDYEGIQAALIDGEPVRPGSRFGVSVQALCTQLGHSPAADKKTASWISSLLHKKLQGTR